MTFCKVPGNEVYLVRVVFYVFDVRFFSLSLFQLSSLFFFTSLGTGMDK